MMVDDSSFKHKVKDWIHFILQHKRLRNIWFFGLILIGFSIFIDYKFLFVVFFIMVFLTWGALSSIEENAKRELDELLKEKEELESILEVMEEHVASGNATLDEKIEFTQLKKELEEINQLIEQMQKKK